VLKKKKKKKTQKKETTKKKKKKKKEKKKRPKVTRVYRDPRNQKRISLSLFLKEKLFSN